MKNLSCFLMTIILLSGISCQKQADTEKEKEAIKAVINGETQAWVDGDTAKFSSFYIHDEDQIRLGISTDTFTVTRGWKSIYEGVGKTDWTNIKDFKFTKDFINIKVMNNSSAWAMYKETQSFINDTVPVKYEMLLTMILEKQDNDWKISGFTVFGKRK